MNRRSFVTSLCIACTAIGLGGIFTPRKYGRINVNEHGPKWRVWLNGNEVSADCYEADDCRGYVLLFCKDDLGKHYYDFDEGDVAREIRFGDIRIERT